MQTYNRQQGGTIIGFMFGLIIGLGIALGVAMVITKTPMPFMDKSGRQKVASPTASQSADPNKPMYGNKKASKEAAKEFVKETAPENTVPQPADIVQVKAAPKPEAKAPVAESLPAVKDAVVKADVKPEDKPEAKAEAKSASVDDKWIYYLQAGAFRETTDAENTRAKLALMGVEAKISERQSETGVLYRVRVGPFAQIDAMNRVRSKLSDNGVDAAVVRIQK